MRFKQSKDSFSTILKIVIGVIFSLVILAISYKAVTTSSENRSKAAETQFTYKSWEFNGATTEGWGSASLTNIRVAKGLLTGQATNSLVTLANASVNSVLPQGNKFITLRLAVGSAPTPSILPTPTKVPVPTKTTSSVSTFMITTGYVNNKGIVKMLPSVRGIADGSFYIYSIKLPDIAGVAVDSMQVTLAPLSAVATIQLDYIRFTGSQTPPTPSPPLPSVRPTPTPTPTLTRRCMTNADCPKGYYCSAIPPGGCPTYPVVNGIGAVSQCAGIPKCWPVTPTVTPTR
jgi:hypothetical protein